MNSVRKASFRDDAGLHVVVYVVEYVGHIELVDGYVGLGLPHAR